MTAYVDPSPENWQTFKSLPRDRPIRMLNLIKFKENAEYPASHPNHGKGLTGREAYALYKTGIAPILRRLSAAMVWHGPLECAVTGPAGEWDEAFVMGYPDSAAFMGLVKDPDYGADVIVHRTAAVADSRLIRFGA